MHYNPFNFRQFDKNFLPLAQSNRKLLEILQKKTLTQTWPHLMHLEENRCISMIFWHNWTSNIYVSTGECGINQINKFNLQEFSITKGYYVIIVLRGSNKIKIKYVNICVQLKVGIIYEIVCSLVSNVCISFVWLTNALGIFSEFFKKLPSRSSSDK